MNQIYIIVMKDVYDSYYCLLVSYLILFTCGEPILTTVTWKHKKDGNCNTIQNSLSSPNLFHPFNDNELGIAKRRGCTYIYTCICVFRYTCGSRSPDRIRRASMPQPLLFTYFLGSHSS